MELVTAVGMLPEGVWGRANIVAVNGCFDMLHAGHVAFLHRAKAFGDRLVVGLNTDESVLKRKGPGRPIHKLEERKALLLELRCVFAVVVMEGDSAEAFLRWIRPDVWVRGEGGNARERAAVMEYGGRIEVVGRPEGLSTSVMIGRVMESHRLRLSG